MKRSNATPPCLRGLALLAGVISLGGAACGSQPTGTAASAEPTASSSALPLPSGSAASMIDAPPAVPATLRAAPAVAFEKDLKDAVELFTVPGAVLIADWDRVGRLGASSIDWKGQLGIHSTAVGRGMIRWAGGRWPDALDITYSMENGRAAQPTYAPFTGKGASFTFSQGGGMGWIVGVARVGESVLVSGYDMYEGFKMAGVRGPAIARHTVPWELKCKAPRPSSGLMGKSPMPALRPASFGASEAGTLFAYGSLCDEEPAVEVWPKDSEKPTIHSLRGLAAKTNETILAGQGDEVWLGGDPVLAWKGDHFEPLAGTPSPVRRTFVSTSRELHVMTDSAIYRWDGARFEEIARLPWPTDFDTIAVEGGTIWVTLGGKLHRLEPSQAAPDGSTCATPLVFLYDVAAISEPTYTFPATRKALASFDRLDGVELVDFVEGRRRLGAIVPSWEVGLALVAHVEKTMKDEKPKLVCHAPKKARKVALGTAK